MKTISHLPRIASGEFFLLSMLCAAVAVGQPVSAAGQSAPDDRDRQVLESVALHVLADDKFDMTRVSTNGTTIILHATTPEKTGFLMAHQIRAEIRERDLPVDAENDMKRRNTPVDARPDTYDSVQASYTNLTFTTGIVVADLTDIWKQGRLTSVFKEAHPKARAWMRAYLPGYSEDGVRAMVRAGVGPSAHGAMLTAVLEKRDGKWIVVWYHVARFV